MPRTPRNGFASSGTAAKGIGLSPPASRVRNTTRRPPKASPIDRYIASCSPTDGGSTRDANRNSVRTRPAPSACASAAFLASSIEPTLAQTVIASPSRVTEGSAAADSAAACARSWASIRCSYTARSSELGSTSSRPASASTTTSSPSRMRCAATPAATSNGMPRARARIAACEVGLPKASTTPRIRPASSSAASAGVRSVATRMPSTGRPSPSTPSRYRNT